MEPENWIQRRPNDADRRCKWIMLRAEAMPTWQRITRCLNRIRKQATYDLSTNDMKQLQRLLKAVQEIVIEQEEQLKGVECVTKMTSESADSRATITAAAFISPWFFIACLAILIGAGFWFARGALVVGLAIPTSIVGTFLVLGLLGRSLNVISLAGLAFAVGMLVDNSVVVLENIYRRYRLGEPPFTAAVRGTQEVLGAVVASTVTTIAVFLPVVFIEEEAGQLFRDIAIAISAAVGLSLIVSMTLIRAASARLFHDKSTTPRRGARWPTWMRRRAGPESGPRLPSTDASDAITH